MHVFRRTFDGAVKVNIAPQPVGDARLFANVIIVRDANVVDDLSGDVIRAMGRVHVSPMFGMFGDVWSGGGGVSFFEESDRNTEVLMTIRTNGT